MASASLARLLRERTRDLHDRVERTGFVRTIVAGRVDAGSYARLVESLYFVYAAMEHALDAHCDHPVVSMLDFDELRRRASLENDLAYWLGTNWRPQVSPSPATRTYVARVREVATIEPPRLVGHLYTRYLGDLSGGEILARALRRVFGSNSDCGAAFYRFDRVADRTSLKERYPRQLDALPLDPTAGEHVTEEAQHAFALNLRLFEELESNQGIAIVD